MPEQIIQLLPSLLGAIAGGLMALLGALWAVGRDYKLRAKEQKQQERAELRAFYQAVHAEMSVFWDSYKSTIGAALNELNRGEHLPCIAPEFEHFPVYEAKLSMLGRIGGDDLRQEIVRVYLWLRFLCCHIVAYSEDVRDYYRQSDLVRRSGQNATWSHKKVRLDALVRATQAIKLEGGKVGNGISELLPKLEEQIEALGPAKAS